ncbi:MAG: hypothetical protein EBQ96_03320 [Proteobacteria bacterium]|nr:hypothetical protein [Pseudomonadota bacterium]
MREKRELGTKVDLERMALTISVSLFMAILAFFIVLNAFSSDSTVKMQSLRNSISSAFGFVGSGQSSLPTDEIGTEQIGQIEEDTAAGLRSVLPDLGFASRQIAGGTIMTVKIKREDLEERWPALRTRLGDLMVNRTRGKSYEIQILALDGPKNASGLASYATDLNDEGVDADKISVGYEYRDDPAIELRFILKGR